MNIFTEEERHALIGKDVETIEAAVLAKLRDGVKPSAYLQTSVEEGIDTVIPRMHKPEKFNHNWWRFDPLYLHPDPQVAELTRQRNMLLSALTSAVETIEWMHGCTAPADDEVEKAIREGNAAIASMKGKTK